jgi:hypothetical protein
VHRLAEHIASICWNLASEQLNAAARRKDQPEQHAHRRRLSRPVGTEEAVPVALPYLQVDRVDGGDTSEALGQRVGRDDGLSVIGCAVVAGWR